MSSSCAIIAESYSFIWQPYVAKWYFFMRANLVKVRKVNNARKLAFAYLSRRHGRRRRQKASDASVTRKLLKVVNGGCWSSKVREMRKCATKLPKYLI